MSRIIKFEVIVHGEPVQVGSLKEAEDRMRRVEQSDFSPSYIVRKEYSNQGNLLEEVMVG
jgi:hypothetical protein